MTLGTGQSDGTSITLRRKDPGAGGIWSSVASWPQRRWGVVVVATIGTLVLALLALGYSGALTWFAPVQPLIAFAGVVLLGYALRVRLKGEIACPVPMDRT